METSTLLRLAYLMSGVGNQVPRYSGWKLPPPRCCGNNLPGLETKYRDIADGNRHTYWGLFISLLRLETKYRDIADGNSILFSVNSGSSLLETKYRDIADGNVRRVDPQ